ncbi:MAG: hypothetical protein ACK5IC_03785 [Moheibacter sp.]
MKISTKKETHNGIQPIRVLKHNLTHRLVDRNAELINELQLDFRLQSHIKYHIAELPLIENQTPFIESSGHINIHETFLAYIWSVTFSMFVMHEEGIAIPDYLKRDMIPPKKHNPTLLNLAKELFDYAKSLIRVYSEWDKEYFPNPEYFDEKTDEGYYILRTNDLYVEVLNFILYHEIAHAEYEHINNIQSNSLSNDEIKNLELEADNRAIELMFFNCRNRNATEIAIVIGLASMLFSRSDLYGGSRHPNVDVRIENYLKKLNLTDNSSVWTFLVIFLKMWEQQFSLNFKQKKEYDTYKELYYELLEQAK